MLATRNSRRTALAFVALSLAFGATSCQDMHAFVTGDQFFKAPKGAPRVEVELVVEVDDACYAQLAEDADREALNAAIADTVLSYADVGMRFFPILTDTYESRDARPERMMTVRVEKIGINTEHERMEEEGEAPWVESSVKSLDSMATASLEKRRKGAPSLVVGRGMGKSHVRAKSDDEFADGKPTYHVKREADDHEELWVTNEDVQDAVGKAVINALREIVEPADRDLAAEDGN